MTAPALPASLLRRLPPAGLAALAGGDWRRAARQAVLALLAGLMWAGLLTQARAAEPLRIVRAWASLQAEGLPAQDGDIDLTRRWDLDFPGRDGRARYRIVLPPASQEDMALLFTRLGNQAEIRLNGVLLQGLGRLGDPSFDAAKAPQLLPLPAPLLHRDGPNLLQIDLSIQALRWGGLSVLDYGPASQIRPLYEDLRAWRQTASIVFAASLAIMGGLVALLWWRQRDPLYGCFSVAAWLGMVRNLDQVWPEPPLPWPLWGALAAACYATHLALICRFTLMALQRATPTVDRLILGVVVLATALAVGSFALGQPLLWTLGLATLVPLGLATVAIVVQQAWRTRSATSLVLLVAGLLAVGAGLHDLLLVRASHSSGLRLSWTTHAIFIFVFIMAGMVAERFSRSVADYRALNAELAQRVAVRETQLRQVFERLELHQREQAVAEERQRIMRELHDGVGAHLVGLMHMVNRADTDPEAVEELVRTALDDMRVAVDSLQRVEGDLTTVLATLRHRLEPRLKAAGLSLVWDMGDLPPLSHLSPQAILQVQRILMEAVTNVIRHAGASRVVLSARCDDPLAGAIEIQLSDDGIGMASDADGLPGSGQGLRNMRARAASLGAELSLSAAEPRGTRVTLRWPLRPTAA